MEKNFCHETGYHTTTIRFPGFTSCRGQDNRINEQGNADSTRIGNKIIEKGKTNSPRINSKVNREYDENGNLRRFDSTYTYSYNYGGGSFADSLPAIIKKHFGAGFFAGDSILSGNSFFDDSFLKDFFAHDKLFRDPFSVEHSKRDTTANHVPQITGPDEYMFNSDRFRQMFRQFDSLNKEFFKNHNFDPEKFFQDEGQGKAKSQKNRLII